jgi:hypothetical protein
MQYSLSMAENVTFRPKRPKAELRRAFGNVSSKINELIDRELTAGSQPLDWRDVLRTRRPQISNEQWERCLTPE